MFLVPPAKSSVRFLDSWFLMGSPLPLICIFTLYFTSLKIGPILMKNRKPFDLTSYIRIYNLLQIAACTAFSYIALTKYNYNVVNETWKCRVYDDFAKNHDELVGIFTFYWYFLLLRTAELIETVFFILRKKHEQASTLHIYHHVSTVIMFYLLNRYSANVMESYVAILNNNVHILMYTYYFFSSFKVLQKPLKMIKPIMTGIQIFQLILILGQCVAAKVCGSNNLFYALSVNIIILIYFFLKFYYETYMTRKTKCESKVKMQ